MVTPHQSVDLCVLTRFSILSDVLSHSWGLFGKRTRLLRNLLPPPPKPSLDKRRDYLFSPERLAYRFWSFETLLLPSLACQDDRRFRHVVFTSEDLPDWASDRLDGLSDRHGFQILRLDTTTDLDTALQAWGPESPGTTTPTATLRIDDDDALARSAVAEIHAQTYTSEDTIVTWPDGLYLTDRGPQGFALRRSSKPFRSCGLTRVLPGTERLPSIFETGRHKNAGQSRHVISIPTPDAYILSVHPDNVSGRKPRRGDARVTEADRALLAERFGIALTPSP